MYIYKKSIVLLASLLFMNTIQAKSLGTVGATFPILEPDLLQVIQTKVALLQEQGELEKLQGEIDRNFQRAMDRPTPVLGLSRATKSSTWLFDPSVTVPADFGNGIGLFAGQRINPLDTVSLKEALLFYDADDVHQVAWAEQTDKALKGNTQLILVGGSVKNQEQRFHKPVYFDQGGRLKDRFQLRHVPTVITQQERCLKIQEVILP